jgi:hypothetical protein
MVSVATPVAVFVATILTPGINALVESATEPLSVALIPTCADAETESKRQTRKTCRLVEKELLLIQLTPKLSC